MKVVVTGKVLGESRQTAEAKLRDAGFEVQSSVTAETDVLVTGERVGATKTNKATALGVEVKTWDEFWSGKVDEEELVPDGTGSLVWQPVAQPASVKVVAPMLAKAADLPVGDDWQFEVKFDGWRCVATIVDGAVSMQSRSAKTALHESYPQIAASVAKLPNCVIDGEICWIDDDGADVAPKVATSMVYVVWDVLELEGVDVRGRKLADRRWMLEEMIAPSFDGQVQLSPVFDDGQQLLDWAAEHGREGVVAKRRSGVYVEGHRGWIKVKCRNEQEFVIVGWTPGKGSNAGRPGGVLLAYWHEDGRLMYAGRCGVAYEGDEPISQLTTRPVSPLGEKIKPPPDTTWVEPELVVQVLFQNWTIDGRLWHPIWKHLRYDKPMEEVTRHA